MQSLYEYVCHIMLTDQTSTSVRKANEACYALLPCHLTCRRGCNQCSCEFQSQLGDVVHSIVLHSNMIAIMLDRFESDVSQLKAYRNMASGMPLTEVSRRHEHASCSQASQTGQAESVTCLRVWLCRQSR